MSEAKHTAQLGVRISQSEFYASIGRLNVHPRSERDLTYWETPDRQILGHSRPGYVGAGEEAYFITEIGRAAITKAGGRS